MSRTCARIHQACDRDPIQRGWGLKVILLDMREWPDFRFKGGETCRGQKGPVLMVALSPVLQVLCCQVQAGRIIRGFRVLVEA